MPMVLLSSITAAAVMWSASFAKGGDNPHEPVLRDAAITPDRTGIAKYLDGLHPTPDQKQRIVRLVQQLGHSDYHRREAAMRALRIMPRPPLEALAKAAKSDDPEVAWRAQRLLRTTTDSSERVLFAVLRTIDIASIKGTAANVLRTIPLCTNERLHDAARRALRSTALPEDAPLLRKYLTHADAHYRRAAIAAIAALLGQGSQADVLPRLKDTDAAVRLEASLALANLGDRRPLEVLGTLLKSEDLTVRFQGANILRRFTGKRFGFTAYAKEEDRKAAAEKWRSWIASDGRTAKLHFPLRDAGRIETGRTLVAIYSGASGNRVVELDAAGKEVLEIKGLSGPWGATRLENGNILVNWYGSRAVTEYDPTGKKQLWNKTLSVNPWNSRYLSNGNILVSHSGGLMEIDRKGKTVWSHTIPGGSADASELASGNLLVVARTQGKVLEITRAGKTITEITGLRSPYRAERLANGNTLIAENGAGRAVEYDRAGKKIVWSKGGFSNPNTVQRLSSGNTLIGDSTGVHEVSPDGRIVWTKKLGICLARRH